MKAQVNETRLWGDGKRYKKLPNGKWAQVSEDHKMTSAEHHGRAMMPKVTPTASNYHQDIADKLDPTEYDDSHFEEKQDPNKVIGSFHEGEKRNGKIINIYNSFDHPGHKNFSSQEHEEADYYHRSKMYDRERELSKTTKSALGGTRLQKVLDTDPVYQHHKTQAGLHLKRADELYESSGQKQKDEERQEKAKQAVKDEAKERREALKSLPQESKDLIEVYKNRLDKLKYHHKDDSLNFGESVGELRASLRSKIENIRRAHLKNTLK